MMADLTIGSDTDFSLARTFFQNADFSEKAVCREAGIESMAQFGDAKWEATRLAKVRPALQFCIQVFLRGLKHQSVEARNVCGEEVFQAFNRLGLLRPGTKSPDCVICPVWVYPADAFVIVSDRRDDPEGDLFAPADDVVFPAIYPGTLRFLNLLPEARGGDALDLCGGSGVGALRFSQTAREAVTADITPRSAHFAEFNARLNGAAMRSLCGDLYAPLQGRQFDIISAHPPFVPATGQTMVYRDGGETGEQITKGVIEGLVAHLRPGGTAVVLCVARDTKDQTFEERAYEWLGPARKEFDIVFGLEKVLGVEEVVDSMRKRGHQMNDQDAVQLLQRLQTLGTAQFVYGALWLCRNLAGASTSAKPSRVRLLPSGSAGHFERLMAWRRERRNPNFLQQLALTRPTLDPRLELKARHIVRERELVPAEFIFAIENGFEAALRLDGWSVPLIARLDGKATVTEVFESAKAANETPKTFALQNFCDLVALMVERGFLNLVFKT
ncbi:MAG TPA: methyltransferase [Candidatus Dormibacteraeota bacterium]|nr:methyltransferase [Candidatus Dormibacteraeota bacterium]